MSIITKPEFLRRQADMIDLCAGTTVDPDTCIRVVGQTAIAPITAYANGNNYEAAVIILEGKPCFIGDRVWYITLSSMVTVTDAIPGAIYFVNEGDLFGNANIDRCLWQAPAPEPFVDPYAALKADQDNGKRIAWRMHGNSDNWVIQPGKVSDESFTKYSVDRWKSVDADVVNVGQINTDYGLVDVQVTKLGLDGTIVVEVVL